MSSFIEVKADFNSLSRRKPVFGVGINDVNYKTMVVIDGKRINCPFYTRWVGMLKRCYSGDYHKIKPTYACCSVAPEWLFLSKFKAWMETQDWQGKHLDKDILTQGNKIYRHDMCIFVSCSINNLFVDCGSRRGKLPVGVCINKREGSYSSYVRDEGKLKYLGLYDTVNDAFEAYKKAKHSIIRDIASSQSEPLKTALLNYKISKKD